MSTLGTPQALASSSTSIAMGTTLAFVIDESKSTLELVKTDGTHVALWGKTLQYAFATQQSMVTLSFTPLPGADPVAASYVNGGVTVSSTQQNGAAMLTIQRPPNTGVSFEIQLEQGTGSLASAIAAPAASARMASARTASSEQSSARAGSTSDPGARLQTRLVFTTVEPPPDPDARPALESS